MFSRNELLALRVAVEQKIASVKRGVNTSKEPEFKALYERSLVEYNSLLAKLQEVSAHEAVKDGSGKK